MAAYSICTRGRFDAAESEGSIGHLWLEDVGLEVSWAQSRLTHGLSWFLPNGSRFISSCSFPSPVGLPPRGVMLNNHAALRFSVDEMGPDSLFSNMLGWIPRSASISESRPQPKMCEKYGQLVDRGSNRSAGAEVSRLSGD